MARSGQPVVPMRRVNQILACRVQSDTKTREPRGNHARSSFVVNAATPKAKITHEAAIALSQHGTVAPVTLHHRTDFAASMIDGRTVMEVDPKSRSAKEVADLWDYIADRLEKNFRRTVFTPP